MWNCSDLPRNTGKYWAKGWHHCSLEITDHGLCYLPNLFFLLEQSTINLEIRENLSGEKSPICRRWVWAGGKMWNCSDLLRNYEPTGNIG
jgi:hypothetical protein